MKEIIKARSKRRRGIFMLLTSNAAVYAMFAVFYCFIQIYLSKSHTSTEVGSLVAIGQAAGIFSPLLFGMCADKARSKNAVLALSLALGAVACVSVMLGNSYLYIGITMFITCACINSFGALIDTITLEYCASDNVNYGHLRIIGTLSYGAAALVLSFFTDDNPEIMFYVFGITAVIAVISVMLSPRVPGHAEKGKKLNLLPVFRDLRYLTLLIYNFVCQLTWAYYLTFFPIHLSNVLHAPDWVWGLNVFMTVLSEIPFFMMFSRIYKGDRLRLLTFIGIAMTLVRYILLAALTSYVLIMIIGCITGVSVSIFTYNCAVYVTRNIPAELQASAQTLMYTVNGLAKVTAGAVGGIMTDSIGTTLSLYSLAGISLVMLILLPLFMKRRKTAA